MADLVEHAARCGIVRDLHGVADATESEGAQRVDLALVGPVLGLELGDLEGRRGRRAHATVSSTESVARLSSEAESASRLSPADSSGRVFKPSTVFTERPRRSATSSGVRRD